jgi:hypothetical protein
MGQPARKDIYVSSATTTSVEHEIASRLNRQLCAIDAVVSFHFLFRDNTFSGWFGLCNYDDKDLRHAIYEVEEDIESQFPGVEFDFHLVAVPPGRSIDDFISNANMVFKRSA